MLGYDWVFGVLFFFKSGNIAAVNTVSVANILNGDRGIIYGTYHMLKGFL